MVPTPPERSRKGGALPVHHGDRASEPNVIPLRSRGWLAPGDRIGGKYKLLTELGEGGMGAVWLAHYEALDIEVAIKVIRSDVRAAGGAEINERLLREAQAAARLGHPAIVRITDFGKTEAGDPYFVMEMLEGDDLADTLERRGRISAVKAVRSLLPIGHALAAAHDKGIVHRDVKPENIIFAELEDGSVQPKLIDFGVAKLDRPANERLTVAGALLGSPGYMSPEQARGEDVDERADIWAFCVVLYEMICGRLPFAGKNYHALLRSIVEDDVQPLTDLGRGDETLWSILDKGLTKNPDRRWQSMRKLGAALARWLIVHDVTEDICGSSLLTGWLRSDKMVRLGDAFDSILPPRIEGRTDSEPDIAIRETTPGSDSAAAVEEATPPATPAAPSGRGDGEAAAVVDAARAGDATAPAPSSALLVATRAPRRRVWQTLAWWALLGLLGAAVWGLWRYREALGLLPALQPAAAPAAPAEPLPASTPELPAAELEPTVAAPAPDEAVAADDAPGVDEAAPDSSAAVASPSASAAASDSAAATSSQALPAKPSPRSKPPGGKPPGGKLTPHGRPAGKPASADLKRPSF